MMFQKLFVISYSCFGRTSRKVGTDDGKIS